MANSRSAFVNRKCPLSGVDGSRNMTTNAKPIGKIPSIRYNHCQAFQPLTPERFNWIAYAIRPLKEPARAEVEK
jgi:hypothetical protein